MLTERGTIAEDMIPAARTTIVGLIASASLFLAGAPSAGAADCRVSTPTQDQYCPPSTITNGGGDTTGEDPGLPFTGYDVGLAAFAAVALVGAGVGLHRASSTNEGA
jgi:hypothetical protein